VAPATTPAEPALALGWPAIKAAATRTTRRLPQNEARPQPSTDLGVRIILFRAPILTGPALGKAVRWLTERGIEEPDVGLPAEVTQDKRKALAESLELLRSRDADGSWDSADGRVISTARNIVWLTRYMKVVEPKVPKATSARPLPKFDAAQRAEVDASILKRSDDTEPAQSPPLRAFLRN